ncbi:ankyrin repeat-containing domain protein [Bisporella sp. PMI_857]|nr:ankyrin repeat-containing domain protein [Bisporella sp. PMI_857]
MFLKPKIFDLPMELLLHVTGYLSIPDLSALSRSSYQLHRSLSYILFNAVAAEINDSAQLQLWLMDLFFHAVKCESRSIAQYLIYSTNQINFNGLIQTSTFCSTEHRVKRNAVGKSIGIWSFAVSGLLPDFTFLHFALLADAPKVAAALMKSGANISQKVKEYPDLMPLYLTLPRSLSSSQEELDLALRIACSYALPKTVNFLLNRGANLNTVSKYGTAAIHTAVMRLLSLSTLLKFGADIELRTQTSRMHKCDPKCWRSIDCDYQGQNALHIASAAGILVVVSCLLRAGANPNLPDEQGCTALCAALVQGHKITAHHILKSCDNNLNPIVNIREQTTALHIACRFSFSEMVEILLRRGASANVIDSYGRTPLHNVLMWARSDREEEVILTLNHLAKFGADSDITTNL